MSEQYPGGFVTRTPPVPDGTTAQGMWTLSQAAGYQKQGLWPAPYIPQYIEDMFQTWLYTGNGSTQTINNGIDLAGKGGMVWIKNRNTAIYDHNLFDTARGTNKTLRSDTTGGQLTTTDTLTAFGSTGFTLGSDSSGYGVNDGTSNTYASWTFREQPNFFDVVTWTGTGSTLTINHSLGSAPGCIIIKRTDTTDNWVVYHRSLGSSSFVYLNLTNAASTAFNIISGTPTSTSFTLGTNGSVNTNGATYVAYLFAHNAGGFGLTGTDNVISCGSFTTDGSGNATVNLGYEPQWLMVKGTSSGWPWYMFDNMRGMPVGTDSRELDANSSAAETGIGSSSFYPTATGFYMGGFGSNTTYIYIAIRRGPMKTPTTGTSVFSPITANSPNGTKLTTNFPVDLSITQERGGGGAYWMDRLRGALSPGVTGNTPYLQSSNTGAETSTTITSGWDNTGLNVAFFGGVSAVWWNLRRAPGFFDEVCYTGTGSARTINHNLGVVPELMLVKQRTASPAGTPFAVYSATMGNTGIMFLNSDGGNQGPDTQWNSTTPTASVFSVGSSLEVNQSGSTYVAYLFASCPGVSKVGSYTGTGTTQVINCGFTAGSRFVMIKRVGTGDWYVWDSARGIVAGNDPYLLLNSTAAEVTNTDFVDTAATGFEISSTAPAAINANGGTFIFLAIA